MERTGCTVSMAPQALIHEGAGSDAGRDRSCPLAHRRPAWLTGRSRPRIDEFPERNWPALSGRHLLRVGTAVRGVLRRRPDPPVLRLVLRIPERPAWIRRRAGPPGPVPVRADQGDRARANRPPARGR